MRRRAGTAAVLVLVLAPVAHALELFPTGTGAWLDAHNFHLPCLSASADLGACRDRPAVEVGDLVHVPPAYLGWQDTNQLLGAWMIAMVLADTALGAYGVANPSCFGKDSESNPLVQNLSVYVASTVGAWLGIWLAADSGGGQHRNFGLLTTGVPKTVMTGWSMASFVRNCR